MIVIKATQRPGLGWQLLNDLCAQVEADAPKCPLVIVADNDTPPPRKGWQVVTHTGPSGSRATGWTALAQGNDRPFMLHLEDDIVLARDGLATMRQQQIPPGWAFVSFFYPIAPQPHRAQLEAKRVGDFRFSQAVKFPQTTVRALLASGSEGYPIVPAGSPYGFDQAVRWALKRQGTYGQLWPNPVDHRGLGLLSNIQHHKGRGAPSGWFSTQDGGR